MKTGYNGQPIKEVNIKGVDLKDVECSGTVDGPVGEFSGTVHAEDLKTDKEVDKNGNENNRK